MAVEKLVITLTNHNRNKQRREPIRIPSNHLEVQEESRVHGAVGFGFASHWWKNWCNSFKPITKRSNRNHIVTFESHLKTALLIKLIIVLLQCSMVRMKCVDMKLADGKDPSPLSVRGILPALLMLKLSC